MKKLIFFPVLIFSLTCCKLESNNNMNDTLLESGGNRHLESGRINQF